MKYVKDALGSRLHITIDNEDSKNDSAITESFLLVDEFERQYSRFIRGNMLEQINSGAAQELQPGIASMVRLAQKVSNLSQGHFDITILPILENMGYGISEKKLEEYYGYQHVQLDKNILTLHNNVQIEFGSCGKGYLLDKMYTLLRKQHKNFVIDFGGDIRVAGEQKIFLEDPNDPQKTLGHMILKNTSIASSSGNRRKIQDSHHLINFQNKEAQDDKIAVYVTHTFGLFADIFATALFVSPLDISLKILESVAGLEALIIGADGKIFKSSGFDATLTI